MTKRFLAIAVVAGLLLGAGCKPRTQEITALQRREAASLASEAQFALSIRDVVRAEATLARAAALCPDTGDYWIELGRCRVRLGHRGEAKAAYHSALAAYEAEAAKNSATRGPALLRQLYVLALLGQSDEARARLAQALKNFPDDRDVRAFADSKQLEQLLASPGLKEVAL